MADWHELNLDEVRQHATHSHRDAYGSRPDVLIIHIDGDEAVLKDYSHSDAWFKRLIAPLLVIREVRSLRKLEGIDGIPRLFHVYGMHAFLMESIQGVAASKVEKGIVDELFFEKMEKLLHEVHARGVTHCDLRSAGNTLVTDDHQPWLVDFVASIHQSRRWNIIGRWIFEQFVEADFSAVLKLKKRLAPDLLTDAEREKMEHPRSAVERVGRKLGRSVRYVTRNLFPSK